MAQAPNRTFCTPAQERDDLSWCTRSPTAASAWGAGGLHTPSPSAVSSMQSWRKQAAPSPSLRASAVGLGLAARGRSGGTSAQSWYDIGPTLELVPAHCAEAFGADLDALGELHDAPGCARALVQHAVPRRRLVLPSPNEEARMVEEKKAQQRKERLLHVRRREAELASEIRARYKEHVSVEAAEAARQEEARAAEEQRQRLAELEASAAVLRAQLGEAHRAAEAERSSSAWRAAAGAEEGRARRQLEQERFARARSLCEAEAEIRNGAALFTARARAAAAEAEAKRSARAVSAQRAREQPPYGAPRWRAPALGARAPHPDISGPAAHEPLGRARAGTRAEGGSKPSDFASTRFHCAAAPLRPAYGEAERACAAADSPPPARSAWAERAQPGPTAAEGPVRLGGRASWESAEDEDEAGGADEPDPAVRGLLCASPARLRGHAAEDEAERRERQLLDAGLSPTAARLRMLAAQLEAPEGGDLLQLSAAASASRWRAHGGAGGSPTAGAEPSIAFASAASLPHSAHRTARARARSIFAQAEAGGSGSEASGERGSEVERELRALLARFGDDDSASEHSLAAGAAPLRQQPEGVRADGVLAAAPCRAGGLSASFEQAVELARLEAAGGARRAHGGVQRTAAEWSPSASPAARPAPCAQQQQAAAELAKAQLEEEKEGPSFGHGELLASVPTSGLRATLTAPALPSLGGERDGAARPVSEAAPRAVAAEPLAPAAAAGVEGAARAAHAPGALAADGRPDSESGSEAKVLGPIAAELRLSDSSAGGSDWPGAPAAAADSPAALLGRSSGASARTRTAPASPEGAGGRAPPSPSARAGGLEGAGASSPDAAQQRTRHGGSGEGCGAASRRASSPRTASPLFARSFVTDVASPAYTAQPFGGSACDSPRASLGLSPPGKRGGGGARKASCSAALDGGVPCASVPAIAEADEDALEAGPAPLTASNLSELQRLEGMSATIRAVKASVRQMQRLVQQAPRQHGAGESHAAESHAQVRAAAAEAVLPPGTGGAALCAPRAQRPCATAALACAASRELSADSAAPSGGFAEAIAHLNEQATAVAAAAGSEQPASAERPLSPLAPAPDAARGPPTTHAPLPEHTLSALRERLQRLNGARSGGGEPAPDLGTPPATASGAAGSAPNAERGAFPPTAAGGEARCAPALCTPPARVASLHTPCAPKARERFVAGYVASAVLPPRVTEALERHFLAAGGPRERSPAHTCGLLTRARCRAAAAGGRALLADFDEVMGEEGGALDEEEEEPSALQLRIDRVHPHAALAQESGPCAAPVLLTVDDEGADARTLELRRAAVIARAEKRRASAGCLVARTQPRIVPRQRTPGWVPATAARHAGAGAAAGSNRAPVGTAGSFGAGSVRSVDSTAERRPRRQWSASKPPPPKVARDVCAQLAAGESREVSFHAYVVRRRPMGSGLVFLDLASPGPDGPELQAALKVQAFADRRAFDVSARVLQPGTLVRLSGVPGATRTQGEGLVVISAATVLAPAIDVYHVAQLVRAAQRRELPRADVAATLRVPAGAAFDAWLGSSDEPVELARGWRARVASGEIASPPAWPAHVLEATAKRAGGRARAAAAPRLLQEPPPRSEVEAALGSAPAASPSVASAVAALAGAASASHVAVEGWVQGRRRFAGNVTFLDLTDEFRATLTAAAEDDGPSGEAGAALEANWGTRLRLALHPHTFGPAARLRAYAEICAPGARVRAEGVVSADGGGTLWVTQLALLRASWQPRALARVLVEVARGAVQPEEAAASLLLEGGGEEAAALADEQRTPPTQRQWALRAISSRLQGEQSRMGTLSEAQARVLAGTAQLRARWPLTAQLPAARADVGVGLAPRALPARTPLAAMPGARAPKIGRAGSWWDSNKRPQIECMLDLVGTFVSAHRGVRPLSVVDIGGGKGSLASALVERFGGAVLVHVVDVARAPLANGAARAAQRGLGNLRFVLADASSARLDAHALGAGCAVDLVVALHACGALSDVAIAQAVRHGAGFVVCPCCYGANGQLRVPVGVLGEGAEGAGVGEPAALPAAQWLGVAAESHAALLHAAELQGDHTVSAEAAHAVCALRAEAAVRLWDASAEEGSGALRLGVRIVQFPVAFSTRNHCLVGIPFGGGASFASEPPAVSASA